MLRTIALSLTLACAAFAQTINVTTLADADPPPAGSLRAAIITANQLRGSASSPITIAFAPPLVNGTIHLAKLLPFLVASHVTFYVPVASQNDRVTIDAGAQSGALVMTGDFVTVRHLRFLNGVGDLLQLYGCWSTLIERCSFEGMTGMGTFMLGSRRSVLRFCSYANNSAFRGGVLAIDGSDEFWAESCTFTNLANTAGIGLTGTSLATITGCVFNGNRSGLQLLEACRDVVVADCQFIGQRGNGLAIDLAQRVLIVRNVFRSQGAFGVTIVDRSTDLRLEDNTFDQNGVGSSLAAAGSSQLLITDSSIVMLARNTWTNGGGAGVELIGAIGIAFDPATPVNRMQANKGSALSARQSSWLALNKVACINNSLTIANAQVLLQDCQETLLHGCTITNSPRVGLQVLRGSAHTITAGTLIQSNAGGGVIATQTNDLVIGPRNVQDPLEIGNNISNNGGAVVFVTCTNSRLNGNTILPGGASILSQNNGPVTITSGSQDCQIGPANTITPAAARAIELSGNVVRAKVVANTASGYSQNGLYCITAPGAEVRDNTFTGTAGSLAGAGIYQSDGVTLFANMIQSHGTQGLIIEDSNGVLVGPRNVIKQNRSEGLLVQRGGANRTTGAIVHSTQISNNASAGGRAAVMLVNSSLQMCNATVVGGNAAWGLFVSSNATATVANSIFWGNAIDRFRQGTSLPATMDYSIYGTQTTSAAWGMLEASNTNTTGNPQLANIGGDDVHLTAASPAKNSGKNAPLQLTLPAADLDGQPRVQQSTVDRGADESPFAFRSDSNSLILAGDWMREPSEGRLDLSLVAPSHANRWALLVVARGAGDGVPLANGAVLPLRIDWLSSLWLGLPELCLVPLDGQGQAQRTIVLTPEVQDMLGQDIAFAFTVLPVLEFVSNPVVVRFFR